MRIVLTTGYYDRAVSADLILARRVAFQRFAEELQTLGHDVLVITPFKENAERVHNGVRHVFVRASWWARVVSFGRSRYELATNILPPIADFQPDVIHFSGLTLDLNLWLISRWAKRNSVPIVVQYHGGEVARNGLRRWIQKGNVQRAAKLLFTAREQAREWEDWAGLAKIVEFTEMSSDFRPKANRDLAGDPALLCVSQLVDHKDPFTILKAFMLIVRERPDAHLNWVFNHATLLPELLQFIAENSLSDHVTLNENVPHADIERLQNGADFFIQASLRDVASIAVLEAMACDVTPILSDIPAFRRLTDGGRIGRLFPVGDAESLAAAVLQGKCDGIRAHFLAHHSYPALARQLVETYRIARLTRV